MGCTSYVHEFDYKLHKSTLISCTRWWLEGKNGQSNGMNFLCTTNLIISHKNQLLLLALGGWLEETNRSNHICNISGKH